MPRTSLDTQEIVRLYVEEEMSVREIATHIECSYGRVYGILRNRVIMRPAKDGISRQGVDHLKVADIMRERIVNGDWPPNRRILARHELAKIFDVTPTIIRAAITHLRQHGYLVTIPGRATYVQPPQHWDSASANPNSPRSAW